MHPKQPKIGVAVFVIKDNKLLLGKRKKTHCSGFWATPGGHLEFGETPEDCANRELLEETGMKAVAIMRGPWTNDILEGSKHYITLFMFVSEFLGTPQNLEPHKCESWEWFNKDNLPQPLFPTIVSLMNKHPSIFTTIQKQRLVLQSLERQSLPCCKRGH